MIDDARGIDMIDDAMDFAAKAHAGQFRKGTRRPYIVHPIEVADIVSSMTKDEEVICAAVLHDTVEDCKGITFDILKLRFGARVADMVAQESEDKSLSWEERKGATITDDHPAEKRSGRGADDRPGGQAVQYARYRPGLPGGGG